MSKRFKLIETNVYEKNIIAKNIQEVEEKIQNNQITMSSTNLSDSNWEIIEDDS